MVVKVRKINGKETLEVQIPLEPKVSSKGKSLLIAKTSGPTQVACTHRGYNLTVNCQAWIPLIAANQAEVDAYKKEQAAKVKKAEAEAKAAAILS